MKASERSSNIFNWKKIQPLHFSFSIYNDFFALLCEFKRTYYVYSSLNMQTYAGPSFISLRTGRETEIFNRSCCVYEKTVLKRNTKLKELGVIWVTVVNWVFLHSSETVVNKYQASLVRGGLHVLLATLPYL